MKERFANELMQAVHEIISPDCSAEFRQMLDVVMHRYRIELEAQQEIMLYDDSGQKLLQQFLAVKGVEGKSHKTIKYYQQILTTFVQGLEKSIFDITTNDLRYYLAKYRKDRKVGNVTLDNMRRVFSSFFGWLADEDYISKSPAKRLNMIKAEKTIKKPFSHEDREKIRCSCQKQRDLALIEFLYSSGVRVSELVRLDRDDIDFGDREVIVFGKGAKEREVYINAQSCLHLKNYLAERVDNNPALFASLKAPYDRLTVSGIEDILRRLGNKAGVQKVHPHRFRRTMATNAMERGMPVQEVSKILGHSKIETTMIYCTVSQENVKYSHRKYLSA